MILSGLQIQNTTTNKSCRINKLGILQRRKHQLFLLTLTVFALLCFSSLTITTPTYYDLKPTSFGSSKPHQIFHVGSRGPISYNIGYGYWFINREKESKNSKGSKGSKGSKNSSAPTSLFSNYRYKYQNTAQGLYVNMICTDQGQNLIWQDVCDNRFSVNSEIKYQFVKPEQKGKESFQRNGKKYGNFQIEIKLEDFEKVNKQDTSKNESESESVNSRQKIKGVKQSQYSAYFNGTKYNPNSDDQQPFHQGDMYWFTTFSIQNTDMRLINHKDYISPMCFTLQKSETESNAVNINLQNLALQSDGKSYDFETIQTLTVQTHSQDTIQIFGFTTNISEPQNSHQYLQELQHLIELRQFPNRKIPRKNDSKIVEWEDAQIKQMAKGQWDSKYTFVVVYGRVSRERLKEYKKTTLNKNVKSEDQPYIYVTNSSDIQRIRRDKSQNHFLKLTKDIHSEFQNSISSYNSKTNSDKSFIHHVVFNLLGGLSYYQGRLFTQNSIISHSHDYSYSFTPSRLIFPRGFLWDDGFHMSVVTKLRPKLTMKIINNWLRKVDLFGWIGREQIRGAEISSMMPDSRFVYQDVFQLNPPTIMLPVIKLIKQAQTQGVKSDVYQNLFQLLSEHYFSLQKHFQYFIKTQSHFDLSYKQDVSSFTIKYRWRCKDECAKGNFMGSGLDDYPRVENPKQVSKEHVDLSSWLYFFADGLEQAAKFIKKGKEYSQNGERTTRGNGEMSKQIQFYKRWKKNLRNKVIDECLDENDLLFKDLAVKTANKFIDQKVNKIGYINLFPFFVGLLKPSSDDTPERVSLLLQIMQKTLEIMLDEQQLMSKGGIRSLSINDTEYASQQNYWRGAVWMPINYMILRACKVYYWDLESDLHRQKVHLLYQTLKQRLESTVRENHDRSGYLFENYIQGEGNRGYPFYGWTSLIASIMLEDY